MYWQHNEESSYDSCEDRYSDVWLNSKYRVVCVGCIITALTAGSWHNNYEVLITGPKNLSRPIDHYLVIVWVIMCLHGFHGPATWSLAVQVGQTVCVCSGIAACFQTSARLQELAVKWSADSIWTLTELSAAEDNTCIYLHVVFSRAKYRLLFMRNSLIYLNCMYLVLVWLFNALSRRSAWTRLDSRIALAVSCVHGESKK